jgi:hypothetical protein
MSGWEEVFFEAIAESLPDLSVDVAITTGAEAGIRLRARGGELRMVPIDEPTAADLVLRFTTGKLTSVLFELSTCDAFREARVSVNDDSRAVLPYGEHELPRTARFELVPGASLVAALHVTSTMFGEVGICERWEDGALVSSELLPASELDGVRADVRVRCTLGLLAALRRRMITPLDALALGLGVLGDWPVLMCYAELVQHSAFLGVWGNEPTLGAQLVWGQLVSSPVFEVAACRVRDHLSAVST